MVSCFCWAYFQPLGGRLSDRMEQSREQQRVKGEKIEAYDDGVLIWITPKVSPSPLMVWLWISPLLKQISVDLGPWYHPWVKWIIPTWLIPGETLPSTTHQMCGFGITESNFQRLKLIQGQFFHPEDRMGQLSQEENDFKWLGMVFAFIFHNYTIGNIAPNLSRGGRRKIPRWYYQAKRNYGLSYRPELKVL